MDSNYITDQVEELVMTCNNEILKKLTVSSIARSLNIDRSYLARIFKSCKNFTLCRFIQIEKMQRAAMLLKDSSNLTIAKLSENLGFCSDKYFREVFKRYFGVVPSKYREYKNHCNRRKGQ